MSLHTCGKMPDRFATVTGITACTCKLVNHTWTGARSILHVYFPMRKIVKFYTRSDASVVISGSTWSAMACEGSYFCCPCKPLKTRESPQKCYCPSKGGQLCLRQAPVQFPSSSSLVGLFNSIVRKQKLNQLFSAPSMFNTQQAPALRGEQYLVYWRWPCWLRHGEAWF